MLKRIAVDKLRKNKEMLRNSAFMGKLSQSIMMDLFKEFIPLIIGSHFIHSDKNGHFLIPTFLIYDSYYPRARKFLNREERND